MKYILFLTVVLCGAVLDAAKFEVLNRNGKPLSAAEKKLFKLETVPGKNYRYKLTSLSDAPQFYRLRYTVELPGKNLSLFDGASSFKINKKRVEVNLVPAQRMPLNAVWDSKRGIALGLGAEDLHSKAVSTIIYDGKKVRMIIDVYGALLRKGAVYSGVWHEFKFSPKYAEREALARYYMLYPQRFKRNPDVDPRLHVRSAQYLSWRSANPELCRFSSAGWDWCIGGERNWGNMTCEYTLPHDRIMGKWMYLPRRDGRGARKINKQPLSKNKYLELLQKRMDTGFFCGTANAFYTTGLSRIHPQLGKKFQDSTTDPRYMNRSIRAYDLETAVWPFPELSWGKEIRRQAKIVSGKYDVKAFAFDVALCEEFYRGSGIKKLQCNIGWDKKGAFVTRGVAAAQFYNYLHTLPTKYDNFKVGAVTNGFREAYHVFYLDTLLSESSPFAKAPPYPTEFRYAMGEKNVTFWEGYHLTEFDPNIRKKWSVAERQRFTNELCHYAVHRSALLGVSLPGSYITEYLYRVSAGLDACIYAGWKPVPGMMTKDKRITLTRYGSGENALAAICNLDNKEKIVVIDLFPEEIRSDLVGTKDKTPLFFAGFYGGKVSNVSGADKGQLSCAVPKLGVSFIEAAGSVITGQGSFDTRWSFALEGSTLEIVSRDFNGSLQLRKNYPNHTLQGAANVALVPGKKVQVFYKNTDTALTGKQLAAMKFTDAAHKPLFTLFYAPDRWSKEIAERVAVFFKYREKYLKNGKVFRIKVKMLPKKELGKLAVAISFDGRIPDCKYPGISGNSSGLILRANSRYDLDVKARTMLNYINRIKYPDYSPLTPMDKNERKYFSGWRY